MTEKARIVLNDLKVAVDRLSRCEDPTYWRIDFIGCMALAHAVQGVLKNVDRVPARIVWTRVCNSGGLFHGGCVTGFMG